MGAIARRMRAIYAAHNPEKLDDVGALLAKYAARPWELCAKVQRKYIEAVPTAGGCPELVLLARQPARARPGR